MTHSRGRGGEDELSALIRDQLHDPANRRFLTRLPVFRPDNDTDDVFKDLLARIKRAESNHSRH